MRTDPPEESSAGENPTDQGHEESPPAASGSRAALRLAVLLGLILLFEILTGFHAIGPGANDFPGAGRRGKWAPVHRLIPKACPH